MKNSAQEKLKFNEDNGMRYHKMIEEVEDYAIILLNPEGIIQNWNRGAEKIKGYKEEEVVGKHFRLFYRMEDRTASLPEILLARAASQGKALHEGWRMRKDGSVFWGSIVLTALHDDEGNLIGFSKVTRDLTERKMWDDKMREYTAKLEFQNKELEQFAYAASHDLKEPLRKIHFFISTILENPEDSLSEKSKEYLSRSLVAARRMNDLIKDLLTYSQATPDAQNFEPVDMKEILRDAAVDFKDEADQSVVVFDPEQMPVINGIPFQIKQLTDNIIGNSIKYKHPDRRPQVNVSCKLVNGSSQVPQGMNANTKYYCLSFTDNGLGFEQQYAGKIFDLFQRLHNSKDNRGSGIGLALCKKIAQNHKWYITAEGWLNEGARINVYIPAN